MKFDKSKVFTVFNLDEIKIGSKVYANDYRKGLIKKVESENEKPYTLIGIDKELDYYPFATEDVDGNRLSFQYVYLVEEPKEKKLKWTDLKIGDVIRRKDETAEGMVTYIEIDDTDLHIYNGKWLTDEELENWEKVE